jgi:periplasmic nitrate reductase NapD
MDTVHIAGLAVLTRSEQFADVKAELATLPGVEVPVADPAGKLVVVLEAADEAVILSAIQQIHAIDGVLTVNLVYHHCEDAAALAQEVDHAHYPT